MTERPEVDREAVIRRTLEDLSDDAYRQDGRLERGEIDATYLRRGITPDEAIAIEQALTAEGVTIGDDTEIVDVTFEDVPNPSSGSALDQLLALARKYPLLNALEEAELGYKIQEGLRLGENGTDPSSPIAQRVIERAERAKTKLVTSNIRLVAKMAFDRRFRYRMDPEDLVQFGLIGLMRACEKFDPNWETRFSTYATWWIRQAIGRGIDDESTTIRLPVHMRARIAKYRRTRRALGLGTAYRASDIRRIAESLGWDEPYTALVAQISEQKVISYDTPIGEDGRTTLAEFIGDDVPNPEELAIAADFAEVIGSLVDDLESERLRDIVRRRFGLDGPAETLQEIGDDYGITRERIRQLEDKALGILRRRAHRQGLHRALKEN